MALRSTHRSTDLTFGDLLKQLRKRAGMTQGDLAAALGYSIALISGLEKAKRRPDLKAVMERFIPALGLQNDPHLAASLIEQAALARGERSPTSITLQRTTQLVAAETFTNKPSRLPIQPTALLGRDQVLQTLCNRLQGHGGRLLTLVGPPGVGKTRLALEVARRLEPFFKDGVSFVPLAALVDPELVAAVIADALELVNTGKQTAQQRLLQGMRHKEFLLLLDNFEQIIAAVPLLATLLAECPKLYLLVTSRERLHLRAEQRFLVPPLPATVASELFIQRAQAVDPDFIASSENQVIIQKICYLVDCLPLAIELSASWVHLLSCTEIAWEIEHNLHFLTSTLRDIPERHRSLYIVFAHSWRLLSPEEQRIFAQLSVFRGKFTRESAAYVADASLSALSALVDKSLLYRNPAGEFETHEYTRQFAAAKLVECNELQATRERHESYFTAQAQEELQRLRATLSHVLDSRENISGVTDKPTVGSVLLLSKQRALRILMLSWEYPPFIIGGSGKHVADLVSALGQVVLDDRPLLIDVLAPRFAGGELEEQLSPAVTAFRVAVPMAPPDPVSSLIPGLAPIAERATGLIQQHNYDLIHIQDWRFANLGIALKYRWHLPLIATFHLIERKRYQQDPPAEIDQIEQFERELCTEAKQIIVCSRFMRQELNAHLGAQLDKIKVIANGIKVKRKEDYPPEELSLLRQQYAPQGQKLLLFIGPAILEKGLPVLIRAMPHILADHPGTRLLVVGKYSDKIHSLAYELHVDKSIDFLGHVSDYHRDCLYQIVDAMIIPSLYEPFGRVALEAMAFGCNVIASNVGGLAEVVKHRENGLTNQPNDPQSIRQAVHLLFIDPAAAQQQRVRALDEIHTLYQWDKIAVQTAQVYQICCTTTNTLNHVR